MTRISVDVIYWQTPMHMGSIKPIRSQGIDRERTGLPTNRQTDRSPAKQYTLFFEGEGGIKIPETEILSTFALTHSAIVFFGL